MSEQAPRTIKFRGKVRGNWMIVTPDDFVQWSLFWSIVDRTTVGQYVDWHDANGVEVYEGDIVRAVLCEAYDGPPKIVVEEVRLYMGLLAPFFMRVRYEEEWWKDCLQDQFAVIGNVHEHPELLQLKEEIA